MGGDDEFMFPSLIRKDSNIFVKKPLPNPIIEAVAPAQNETTSLSSSKTKSFHSYESFDQSGDDSVSSSQSLERHLNLTDLILIGIGGTIGSGLFVLCGLVSNQYAGPATAISWTISGAAACISGACYAELSSRIPLAGSAYAYTFVAMGEFPAILAAACLSLEYIAAASAVARSWGDKIEEYLLEEVGPDNIVSTVFSTEGSFSPFAFLVSAGSVILLLNGVKESKFITNAFTSLKVAVVLFMVIAGAFYIRPSNWVPFIPTQFGVSGVLRGATGTFFGYLGYDEITCLGAEAENPARNLPRAILFTLGSVTTLYILASLCLTGMVPYDEISPVSGFPSAFRDNQAIFAAEITALGEIITLPIVVLITIMAQPRLQYAMSKDGLLPPIFGELDEKGNLHKGTVVCGVVMVLIATFIPFTHLNDMISCAVLTALSLTDTSLVLLWHPSPPEREGLSESALGTYHVASLVTGILLTHYSDNIFGKVFIIIAVLTMIACVATISVLCPKTNVFGKTACAYTKCPVKNGSDSDFFRTPFVPTWPCLGIFINWYLISQLEPIGVIFHLGFLALATLYYFLYGIHHSVGNNGGWIDDANYQPSDSQRNVINSDEEI